MAALTAIGGTSVADYCAAMRLSEAITIYLAAGAPVTVNRYLAKRKGEGSALSLLRATSLGLVWPLAVLRILLIGYGRTLFEAKEDHISQECEARIQNAKRNVLASLHGMREFADSIGNTPHEDLERAVCVLHESIETYVGLAPSIEESSEVPAPNESTMELFRVAGYTGNDIAVAATCANRRNAARIMRHHNRARVQMVHAVADICDAVESICTSMSIKGTVVRQLCLASTEISKLTINLLVLIGDEATATRIAELLNHGSLQPRRIRHNETRENLSPDSGEVPCIVHTSRPPHAPLSNEATMAQG